MFGSSIFVAIFTLRYSNPIACLLLCDVALGNCNEKVAETKRKEGIWRESEKEKTERRVSGTFGGSSLFVLQLQSDIYSANLPPGKHSVKGLVSISFPSI